MRAECPRRSHRPLAQRGRIGTTHRPALTNTDRSQPDAGTEHRQPDGRAEHGLDRSPTPSSSSTSASGFNFNLTWLWVVLGALVLLAIILLATRSPARARPSATADRWRSRAVDAYAKGAALDGAVRAAERQDLFTEAASVRLADLQRRADDLTEALFAMRETAPTEHRRVQVENAILSLRAVRDAVDARREPGEASARHAGVLSARLSALESSLNALRVPDDPLV